MFERLKRGAIATTLLGCAALITGCGGSDDGTTASGENGEVIIGLTDAEGDFLSYAVDVTAITLTRADGTTVETLPLSTRIDFTQYVEMTEFITAATVPSGRYVAATLAIDYSDADIQVESGGAPVAAAVVDGDGNRVDAMTMTIRLEGRDALVIAPGVPAHLTLDFDLQASHEVDTSTTPPTVTVEPMLLADVNFSDPKPHRLRGLLEEVDQAHNHFRLAIRPLLQRHGRFGHLRAHIDDETHFEIDGTVYRGSAGLAALEALGANAWTVVIGLPDRASRDFLASEVYAGSSVPGADRDSLIGVVTARSGDTLTVDAGAIVTRDGRMAFHRTVEITLAADTPVSRQLGDGSYGKDDISIGQRIATIGTLASDGSSFAPDRVRMLLGSVAGNVVSANPGEVVADLQGINGRPASQFDFSGTGVTPADDADPANYQIDTATLALATLAPADPIVARGFVTPFGSAPADFEALSVIDLSEAPARLLVSWSGADADPFTSLSTDALVIDLADSQRHHIKRGRIVDDLTTLATAPTLVASDHGRGLYALRQPGQARLFARFGDFALALQEALDGSLGVTQIAARGRFDDATATFAATRIAVRLEPLAP